MEHKPTIRERLHGRMTRAKVLGGAMVAGAAGVVATAGGVAAEVVEAEPTLLAKYAADFGMTVPSLLLFILLIVSFVVTIGWVRSQYAYYITGGLGLLWLIVHWLGL